MMAVKEGSNTTLTEYQHCPKKDKSAFPVNPSRFLFSLVREASDFPMFSQATTESREVPSLL